MNRLMLSFYYQVQSAVLYLINLITVRRLRINALDIRFEMVGNKPRAIIFWDVQGCHRIDINICHMSLPGKTKGVSLKIAEANQAVTIKFKGVFNTVERSVAIQASLSINHFLIATPPNFSISLYPSQLEPKIYGLSILTKNYESVKLLNDFAAQELSNTFSESVMYTHITPSPADFLKISQKEQIYFQ